MPLIKDVAKDRSGKAGTFPRAELALENAYDTEALSQFIPKEVLDVSEGSGVPVGFASLRPGEAVLQIGCEAGIDCFEAARRVGSEGKVVGVETADDMLAIARRNAPQVAGALKLNPSVIEFKKGSIENLPLEHEQFDAVVAYGVVNQAQKKAAAFEEIFRVLRPGGRFAISDIVSDRPIPEYIRANEEKWGRCLSGSLFIADYLKAVRKAGFLAVEQIQFKPWRRLDGIHFYAVTIKAEKLDERMPEKDVFDYAVFRGPFLKVKDERGNAFQRGQSKKISRETSQLLSTKAYRPFFALSHEARNAGSLAGELLVVPREDKKDVWEGDYATLSSLFLSAEDDDRQIFYAGEPLEIDSRVKHAFTHEYFRPFFSILTRVGAEDGEKV